MSFAMEVRSLAKGTSELLSELAECDPQEARSIRAGLERHRIAVMSLYRRLDVLVERYEQSLVQGPAYIQPHTPRPDTVPRAPRGFIIEEAG